MKHRVPFPVGLWAEIALTYQPKVTVFLICYGLSALGAGLAVFGVAKERIGLWAGLSVAPLGALAGWCVWHLIMLLLISSLKMLVKAGVMEDPSEEKRPNQAPEPTSGLAPAAAQRKRLNKEHED